MDSLSDIRTAIRSDLNVSDSSSLYPQTTIDLAINRAHIKATRLFNWPQLMDAKKTSTQSAIENYDLPTTWSPDSAWRLEVDDSMYGEDPDGSPMDFNDYLLWKEDNTGSDDKKWTVHGNQLFIYPTPTSAGDYNISVWGQKNATELTDDTDTTIFSYAMPEGNEAILLEALAILKKKGENDKSGQMVSEEAKQILIVAYKKIRSARAKYEKTQPFLEVPDMFGKTSTDDLIGRF